MKRSESVLITERHCAEKLASLSSIGIKMLNENSITGTGHKQKCFAQRYKDNVIDVTVLPPLLVCQFVCTQLTNEIRGISQ